jgi:hypothetical protein
MQGLEGVKYTAFIGGIMQYGKLQMKKNTDDLNDDLTFQGLEGLLGHIRLRDAISTGFWISNLILAETKLIQALEGKMVPRVVQTIVLLIYLSISISFCSMRSQTN